MFPFMFCSIIKILDSAIIHDFFGVFWRAVFVDRSCIPTCRLSVIRKNSVVEMKNLSFFIFSFIYKLYICTENKNDIMGEVVEQSVQSSHLMKSGNDIK